MLAGLIGATGCGLTAGGERNAFLTLTETFGSQLLGEEDQNQVGGGDVQAPTQFRATMTLTLVNASTSADLNVRLAAWVNVGSVRSREQEDALFSAGYVQLEEDIRLGNAFVLPAGTFVLDGAGLAGARSVFLPASVGDAAEGGEEEPAGLSSVAFDLVTPDAILLFYAPPVSCDSVAFVFTQNGEPVQDNAIASVGTVFGGSSSSGGQKTLGQINVYQCQPFRPGLFLKRTGGAARPNEFFEGDDIRVEFRRIPDANGAAATVTIGG